MKRGADRSVRRLSDGLRQHRLVLRDWLWGSDRLARGEEGRPFRLYLELATGREISDDAFADMLIESLVCGALAILRTREVEIRQSVDQLADCCGPLLGSLLRHSAALAATLTSSSNGLEGGAPLAELVRDFMQDRQQGIAGPATSVDGFYEQFLGAHDRASRSRHGVYYTPHGVARFIVEQIDGQLREEFDLQGGLSDPSRWSDIQRRFPQASIPDSVPPQQPYVQILDPAVGTGVFLVEVIDCVFRAYVDQWRGAGLTDGEIKVSWNDYVHRCLLPRLKGIELLPPSALVAVIEIAAKLRATGYVFRSGDRVEIYVADTLLGPDDDRVDSGLTRPWEDELARSRAVRYSQPATIVLGNPPFSAISSNRSEWIQRLLKGSPRDSGPSGYYEVDGQPLGERKLWLQDDYVKFFRYAHWQVERAGSGVIGLITNHGYLDNASFRGMRHRLLEDFPLMTILDLHGNRKKMETAPGGETDANVFAIDQGVAVGLFRKPTRRTERVVRHGDLWGRRADKLAALGHGAPTLEWKRLRPTSPHYLLTPRDALSCGAYRRAVPLNEAMPVASTAAVTARDRFVVARNKEELLERMRKFRDLRIADDEIRRTFFTRGRSRKYPPGDTRGWKLAEARRRMANDVEWQNYVRACLYRPFDRRVIYWADWMIDWPRHEVMQHLLAGENVALVTRRQMLPSQPCSFFWVADAIVVDGLIRSDNRGSESFFPLYLYGPDGKSRRANFATSFVDTVAQGLQWNWREDGVGDLQTCFGPEDLLAYVYGVFHATSYRSRYAAQLRTDFPQVPIPGNADLFSRVVTLGKRLIAHHLDPCTATDGLYLRRTSPRLAALDSLHYESKRNTAGTRMPAFENEHIWLDTETCLSSVPAAAWEFQVGGHQVCRKWLRDRPIPRSDHDLQAFRRLVATVMDTLQAMSQLDHVIDDEGGWSNAFLTASK